MAIEVISRGTKPEERTVNGACVHCKSVLRWKASDGKGESNQRDGDFNVITCPVCREKVFGNYAKP